MLKGSPVPTTLHEESDEDLLCWMSMREEDPNQAEEAWLEFYNRHIDYLYGVCANRLTAYGLRREDITDLVQSSFLRAFAKAGTFRAPPESRNPESDRAWVRAWLGKIAYRLLADSFRRTPILVLVEDKKLDVEVPKLETECSQDSPRLKLVREALGLLTDREREIMLVSYTWYEPGKQLTIPEEDLKQLASEYRTTTVNLRQIRARAKQKIEDYITNHERQS
jgi:RNA polymerase sigma factor (sigma-70 family)